MSGVDVACTGAVISEVSNFVTSSTVVDNLAGEAANTKDVNDAQKQITSTTAVDNLAEEAANTKDVNDPEMQKYGPPSSTGDSAGNERCTFKDIWSLNNIPLDIMQYLFNSVIKSLFILTAQ